jgi:aminopeptidase N
VNSGGSGDMYNKGSNLLHTLRQVVNDDAKWKATLRGLNSEFYHKTVSTKEIEDYMSKSIGRDLKPFFDQYLRDVRIPVLEYRLMNDGKLFYYWSNCIPAFNMPVKIWVDGKEHMLNPTTRPQQEKLEGAKGIKIDPNFYVYSYNTME